RQPGTALRRCRHRGGLVAEGGVGRDRAQGARAPGGTRSRAVNLNYSWAAAVADELARGGVREAVLCPGSRSAPLAISLAARLRAHVVVDERSAGFFALGAAKVTGRPVAVLCTSGSAGAHLYPALLEAEASGV